MRPVDTSRFRSIHGVLPASNMWYRLLQTCGITCESEIVGDDK